MCGGVLLDLSGGDGVEYIKLCVCLLGSFLVEEEVSWLEEGLFEGRGRSVSLVLVTCITYHALSYVSNTRFLVTTDARVP